MDVDGMARDKLRMRPLPLGQTPTLMQMLMAMVIMVTTVHTTEVITMERDKLRMSLPLLDQTLTQMLMAMVIMVTTVHTTTVTTGENKIPTNANLSSKYFSSNN